MDHIGAFVSDLERAVAWCQDMLGMRLAAEDHDGGARMAVLRFGGQEVHLFEDKMGRTAPRLDHVAGRVRAPGLEEAMRRLGERGVAFSGPHTYQDTSFIKVRDPDGLVWELIAPAPHPAVELPAEIAKAYALDREGREAEACVHYDAAYAAGVPDELRPGFLLGYGSTLKNVGRLEDSERILRLALAERPDDRALQAFLALTLHAAGRPAAAIAVLLDALLSLAGAAPDIERYQRALQSYRDELAAGSIRSPAGARTGRGGSARRRASSRRPGRA
jgi:catechol 2,3-dioxygenase-like lactoylglutathione lyase family enzyme